MDAIMSFANTIFQPIIDLGAAPFMLIVVTILACCFKVKFSQALMGGIKLALVITGISAIVNLLTTSFAAPMQAFVENTGLSLHIQDVGWAPLATITWSNPATLYFLLLMVALNVVMLILNKTNTIDVDVFNIWHLALVGLLCIWFGQAVGVSQGTMILITTVLVLYIGFLKIMNSDLMKPTFSDLLDTPEANPMTTTHMNYMMNPINMLINKIFDTPVLRWIDKFDFDAAKLNEKIGFWGSKFAIGIYLGIFVGLLGGQSPKEICTLAFTAGVCLELFALVGSWFVEAIEPLGKGITDFARKTKKLQHRTLNIGLDWVFLAGRAEVWATANILAPIMLLESIILPHNAILPLAGIIAMGVTPSLLVVTRGKMIRMVIIGTIILPLFLWSGTLMAPFVTEMATSLGAMPAGITGMISGCTIEGPVERFLAYTVGSASSLDIHFVVDAIIMLILYTLLFIWYRGQMIKRNVEYVKQGKCLPEKNLTGKYTDELIKEAEEKKRAHDKALKEKEAAKKTASKKAAATK